MGNNCCGGNKEEEERQRILSSPDGGVGPGIDSYGTHREGIPGGYGIGSASGYQTSGIAGSYGGDGSSLLNGHLGNGSTSSQHHLSAEHAALNAVLSDITNKVIDVSTADSTLALDQDEIAERTRHYASKLNQIRAPLSLSIYPPNHTANPANTSLNTSTTSTSSSRGGAGARSKHIPNGTQQQQQFHNQIDILASRPLNIAPIPEEDLQLICGFSERAVQAVREGFQVYEKEPLVVQFSP